MEETADTFDNWRKDSSEEKNTLDQSREAVVQRARRVQAPSLRSRLAAAPKRMVARVLAAGRAARAAKAAERAEAAMDAEASAAVDEYWSSHNLNDCLEKAMSTVLVERPPNPCETIGNLMISASREDKTFDNWYKPDEVAIKPDEAAIKPDEVAEGGKKRTKRRRRTKRKLTKRRKTRKGKKGKRRRTKRR